MTTKSAGRASEATRAVTVVADIEQWLWAQIESGDITSDSQEDVRKLAGLLVWHVHRGVYFKTRNAAHLLSAYVKLRQFSQRIPKHLDTLLCQLFTKALDARGAVAIARALELSADGGGTHRGTASARGAIRRESFLVACWFLQSRPRAHRAETDREIVHRMGRMFDYTPGSAWAIYQKDKRSGERVTVSIP